MIIFRDCYPRGQVVSIRDSTRFEICRSAMIEKQDSLGCSGRSTINPVVGNCPYIKEFYRCLILLNAQETRDRGLRISVAKDYFQNAAEICYLVESRL